MSIIKTLTKTPLSASKEDLEKLLQVLENLESSGLWVFPGVSFIKKGFDVFGSQKESLSVSEGDKKVTFVITKKGDDIFEVTTTYEVNGYPLTSPSNPQSSGVDVSINSHWQHFREETNRLFTEQHHRDVNDVAVIHNHHHTW